MFAYGNKKVIKGRKIRVFYIAVVLVSLLVIPLQLAMAVEKVSREEQLIINQGEGTAMPHIFNPYALTAPEGMQSMFEHLFYYNMETGKIVPWLAKDYEYNNNMTEVTVHLRKGVEWSDGVSFTAEDVAFTFNMLLKYAPILMHSAAIKEWVKEVKIVDDYTVQLILTKPNSRFVFQFLTVTWSAPTIVPKHIWKDVDPIKFTNYDFEKGWPVVTGPYRLIKAITREFVYERRDDWWGAKTGFHELPEPKQVIWISTPMEESRASLIARNKTDLASYLSRGTYEVIKAKNPNVISWYENPPYAWMEAVPYLLDLNNQISPWDDPEIHWAISYALDHEEITQIATEGIAKPAKSLFPNTPPLREFVDNSKDLFEKYPVTEYNPDKTKEILERKGFKKGEDGFWITPEGEPFQLTIDTPAEWPEPKKMGMIIAEQLQRVGIDARVRVMEWGGLSSKFWSGQSEAWGFWLTGSLKDPWKTFDWHHSKWVKPLGERQTQNSSRWVNKEYDKIVDKMALLSSEDPQLWDLARKALEIWLRELPCIPTFWTPALFALNTTYWTNWPTAKNNYVQPYFQLPSVLLWIIELEPAKR